MPEAPRQHGTRQADFMGQIRNGPGPGRIAMQQSQRLADFRVASTRQPAGLPRGQSRNVTPEGLDEKRFGKARQHRFSA